MEMISLSFSRDIFIHGACTKHSPTTPVSTSSSHNLTVDKYPFATMRDTKGLVRGVLATTARSMALRCSRAAFFFSASSPGITAKLDVIYERREGPGKQERNGKGKKREKGEPQDRA